MSLFTTIKLDDSPICKTCIYFQLIVNDNIGECRVCSPVAIDLDVESIRFPLVSINDWCGNGRWFHDETMSTYSGVLFWQYKKSLEDKENE